MIGYRIVFGVALFAVMLGCNVNTSVPESKEESAGPIASGSPGETGSISGNSPPPGSQVEVYENFIIVTPEDGIKWLSPSIQVWKPWD